MNNKEQFDLCLQSDTYKQWTKGCTVVQVVFAPLQQSVYCLLKEDVNTFSVMRFFSFTENKVVWNVSGDLRNTTYDEVVTYLMDQLSDTSSELSIEPQKFFDKHDEQIIIGCKVICDQTDDNEEFQGRVVRFETASNPPFVVVAHQEGDAFCIDADKLEVIQ